mmetsp:Transcript_37326/g.98404  ORF Transcript_37326/g.98404 Transcript_37326/m.98404 type:complete len:926 (+) Transcript_37326:38-2815(+)
MRPLLKFSLAGTRPPGPNTVSGQVLEPAPASPASSAAAGARSTSSRAMPIGSPTPPVLQPSALEVLPADLAVVSLGGSGAPALLADSLSSGTFFAILRRSGGAKDDEGSWWAVIDAAAAEKVTDGNGDAPRRVAAFRLLRPSGVVRSPSGEPLQIFAALCRQISEAGLAPWPLVVGDEELLLVDRDRCAEVALELIRTGHAVGPPARVAPLPELEQPLASSDSEKLCGVWRLVERQRPSGTVVEKFGRGEGPLRIQAPSGIYVEVAIRTPGETAGQLSSCGTLRVEWEDGQLLASRHRFLGFMPPAGRAHKTRIALDLGGGDEGEDVAVETRVSGGDGYEIERWERIANGEVTVLELSGVDPRPPGGLKHTGLWMFCANHWARITGPSYGEGLIASSCCRSFSQLQDIIGGAALTEFRAHYQASCGTFDKAAILAVTREAWASVGKASILYDASKSRDEIRKDGDVIVHAPHDGTITTWDVKSFAVDPFTPAPKHTTKPAAPKGLRQRGGSSDSSKSSNNSDKSSTKAKGKKKSKTAGSDSSSDSSKGRKKAKAKRSRSSSSAKSSSSARRRKASDKDKRKRSRSNSKDRKRRSRSRSRDKRDRDSSRKRDRDKKDRSSSRDRGKDRDRSRSRDRDRRDRDRSRSRDRDRDRRDKDRDRSRSRAKKERDRSRDRSRDRDRDKKDRDRDRGSRDRAARDKDKDKERDRGSRGRDRRSRDRSRDRDRGRKDKDRDRSRDKKSRDRKRSRSASSKSSRPRKDRDRSRERSSGKGKDKKDDRQKKTKDQDSSPEPKAKQKKKSNSSSSSDDEKEKEKKGKDQGRDKPKKKARDSSSDADSSASSKKKGKARGSSSESEKEAGKKKDKAEEKQEEKQEADVQKETQEDGEKGKEDEKEEKIKNGNASNGKSKKKVSRDSSSDSKSSSSSS